MWLIFALISLQSRLSLSYQRPAGPEAIDKLNLLPKFSDPSSTSKRPIYLTDGGRVHKLAKQMKRLDEYHGFRTGHPSGRQSDERSNKIQLTAESDHQSNEENYLEYDQVDKSDASSHRQPEHMDPNGYYHYSDVSQPNGHSHSSHQPPYSHQHPIKPYKPIYVSHPDKVNPLLILAQDTIRLQEAMLLAMMPHFLRSHLIRIMDGQMGRLKGSKNTQYDPDNAWFGQGILMKAKKPYR